MRYFQGCGYSDEFTENMRYVISNLKSGSEVLLTRAAVMTSAANAPITEKICVVTVKRLKATTVL